MKQDLRSFVEAYAEAYPGDFVRIKEPVDPRFDLQAVALELERRRRFPILLFESVAGSDILVIANVLASRKVYAFALGVDEARMPGEYARRLKQYVKPVVVDEPWFQQRSWKDGEVDLANALRRVIPNVRAVHVPTSGCAAFTAFVSIRQTRPGEAKHAIPIVFGVDHYLKFVVIVDDDIDVFDESAVLWALATRVQADRDLVVLSGTLGAILDPSASEFGLAAKLGVDATRPFGQPFAEKLSMTPENEAWARQLVDRLLA